jgi:hypothetical protein
VGHDDSWLLIDAEFARPFGAVMPTSLRVRDTDTLKADAAADCYQVSRLVSDRPNSFPFSTEEHRRIEDWKQLLLPIPIGTSIAQKAAARKKVTVKRALGDPFFGSA